MPQLDIYIICNMLYGVIIMFIVTYMLNINNILITINLLLRIRKLKICLIKKYILKILLENLLILKIRLYFYIFNRINSILKEYKHDYVLKNILDVSNLKYFLYEIQDK